MGNKKQIKREARYEAAFNLLIHKATNRKKNGYSALYTEDVEEVLAVAGLSLPELRESEGENA